MQATWGSQVCQVRAAFCTAATFHWSSEPLRLPAPTPCCLSQFKLHIIFCATPRAAPGRTRTTPAKCRKKRVRLSRTPKPLGRCSRTPAKRFVQGRPKTEKGGSREDRIRQASSSAQPPLVPIMPTKFFFPSLANQRSRMHVIPPCGQPRGSVPDG